MADMLTEAPVGHKSIDNMTKVELTALAEQNGVKLNSKETRLTLVEKLKKFMTVLNDQIEGNKPSIWCEMKLTKDNLIVYAAKHYYNPKCIDSEEFFEDLKRFKYIKRLLNRYETTGELSERLIINHLIVIFNVFGFQAGLDILELKIDVDQWGILKPFLIFLKAIKNTEYTNIEMDKLVVERLREI